MKKLGVALAIFIFVFLIGFSFAANETTNSTNTTSSNVTTTSSSNSSTASTSTLNMSQIQKAFACLETQVKADCSGAKNIQEIALTIMASPDNVEDDCRNRLKTFIIEGKCFGSGSCNIKDTALAVLALNHIGEKTEVYQNWLKNQTRTSSDLIWFMQQDSNEAATCKVRYDSQDYEFNVAENKKIDSNAGSCLSLANSNYWYSISSNCYEKQFTLLCNKDFIGTLLYKQPNSPIIYILSDTKSAAANNPIDLQVKSKCFGANSCEYESSAWAALALSSTGNNVDDYIPYLIAAADLNPQYLPNAFLNMIVSYSDYGTKLIQQQSLGSWTAENTAYNQYYDTALALISLSDSSSEQVKKGKDWLIGWSQADGCWNNDNIRDTAISLWALQKRSSRIVIGGGTELVGCTQANFYCIPYSECPSNQILSNYAGCNTNVCCQNRNLKTCSEYFGEVCSSGKVCDGNVRESTDSSSCCLGSCVDAIPADSACSLAGGTCKDSCSTNQEESSATCDASGQVCCVRKIAEPKKSLLWLWILLAILIILIALAILFKDKIKEWWNKRKTKFKKDEGSTANSAGHGPTSPGTGFGAQRPMMRPPQQGLQPNFAQRRPLPMGQPTMPPRMPPKV